MAAAEYYNATAAAQTAQQHSPYHQSPYQRPHELHGSPVPQYSLPQGTQHSQGPPPPPYQPVQQDGKPAVHFTPSTQQQQSRPSRPTSNRPSFSNQAPPRPGQYLQPPPHHSPYAQHAGAYRPAQGSPHSPPTRPYMNGNQSEYSLNPGYSSDPEPRRRRRHRHRDQHSDRDDLRSREARDERPHKNRSRSTNTDSFLGAAGGGLIGDMIFPGLGTVGGAIAGWIGGRDYGKHRKYREEKLHREQKDWEHHFQERSRDQSIDRSSSDDSRRSEKHHDGHRRRKHEY